MRCIKLAARMISYHNPFPGMNPFLEHRWSDVHTRLIGYIGDELARGGLPQGLRARTKNFSPWTRRTSRCGRRVRMWR